MDVDGEADLGVLGQRAVVEAGSDEVFVERIEAWLGSRAAINSALLSIPTSSVFR